MIGFQLLALERDACVCGHFPLSRNALLVGLQEEAENHCSQCHCRKINDESRQISTGAIIQVPNPQRPSSATKGIGCPAKTI